MAGAREAQMLATSGAAKSLWIQLSGVAHQTRVNIREKHSPFRFCARRVRHGAPVKARLRSSVARAALAAPAAPATHASRPRTPSRPVPLEGFLLLSALRSPEQPRPVRARPATEAQSHLSPSQRAPLPSPRRATVHSEAHSITHPLVGGPPRRGPSEPSRSPRPSWSRMPWARSVPSASGAGVSWSASASGRAGTGAGAGLTDCPRKEPVSRRSRSIMFSSHWSSPYRIGCERRMSVSDRSGRWPGR